MVCLSREGQNHPRLVHRLILLAFVGECPDGLQACHYDGDKSNCRLSNLRYDTPKGNAADKVRHGTNTWRKKSTV